jgi:hypothetical protein
MLTSARFIGADMTTIKEQRRQHVATMRANFGIEDMHPTAEDLAWQERYIDGTASLDDLLNYAHTFAKARREREDAANFARASVGLEGLKPSALAEACTRQIVDGQMSVEEAIDKIFKNPRE